MIGLELSAVARGCPGRLETAAGATAISGVQIDSRRVTPGDLFVAVGPGSAYVQDALAAGAAAALVPEDAFASLAQLGGMVRDRSAARVVGITGSTGKTSTKDILAAVCAPHVRTVAAEASFNNELGVPLTLCRLEEDTELCIVELAMRGLGQIAELADVARPDVGVITNVGPAHVELVGSVDAVVRAKGELVDALPSGGVAVVPAGFPVSRTDLEVVRVGEAQARVVHGRTLVRFGEREVSFDFRARHQARNALFALHAARAVGVEPEDVVDVAFSPWRGEEVELPGGGLLVNDCYNANPISMQAALEHLADVAKGRRTVAVLGEMAELGDKSVAYHRAVAGQLADLGIDAVLAVGPLARHYLDSADASGERRWAPNAEEAAHAARELVRPGDCVLVKASRAVGLELVAAALAGAPV